MVTIKDVAKHACVSASCVSKYPKDVNSVRPHNRKQIADAIAQLNCILPGSPFSAFRQGHHTVITLVAEMNGGVPECKNLDCSFVPRESTGHDS